MSPPTQTDRGDLATDLIRFHEALALIRRGFWVASAEQSADLAEDAAECWAYAVAGCRACRQECLATGLLGEFIQRKGRC